MNKDAHVDLVDAHLDGLVSDPDVTDAECRDALDDIISRCQMARDHISERSGHA